MNFSDNHQNGMKDRAVSVLIVVFISVFLTLGNFFPKEGAFAQELSPTPAPGMTVKLTADPKSLDEPGGIATITVEVFNDLMGSEDLTITELVDSIHGDLNGLGTCSVPQTLLPEESYSCSYEMSLKTSETIMVTLTGMDDQGALITGSGEILVPVAETVEAAPPAYFFRQGTKLDDGTFLERVVINGPPDPPPGYSLRRSSELLPEPNLQSGTNTLTVPAYEWSFGCSATSAAMIAGYFDINGYPEIYTGPANGGVMPLTNSIWPYWVDGCSDTRAQNPLSATHSGLDGRGSFGHVDDYWTCYDSSADDPFIIGGWPEHTHEDAAGDFMYTNQSSYGIVDGATQFWGYDSNEKLFCSELESLGGVYAIDGTVGFKNFYESRGYSVTDCYYQLTDNQYAGGFSFEDYKAEIDSGQPVMLHVVGHTMVGVGYADPSTVYLHDTWDYNTHTMTWGGSYLGMDQFAVSIVHLASPEIDIQGSGQSIPDGDAEPSISDDTDFGEAEVGIDTVPHLFTIYNTGSGDLSLTGVPMIEVTGTHAADFSLTVLPSSPVAGGGGTTSFEITFDPGAGGLREAEVVIANNDSDENPYNYAIQGTGITPEIDLLGNGQSIADGDTEPSAADGTDFGEALVDFETTLHTFTIENTGSVPLILSGEPKIEITGPHPADFTVTGLPSSPVAAAGGTTTFEITFDPSAVGVREAEVMIANSDSDEDPYNFWIQGTGDVTFVDVPPTHWAYDYIEALWAGGYTAGCTTDPLAYCPEQIMNRAMSAVFMLRGQFGTGYVPPAEPWDTFTDDWSLSDISWAEKWAEGMWEEGLSAGCLADPLMYCPRRELPRVEASVFALRMLHGVSYTPPPATGTLFGDMTDPGYWGAKWAEQAFRDGLIPECGWQGSTPLFCPDDLVDRAFGAYLIVLAKDLPVPNELPQPTLISPSDDAVTSNQQPTFEWGEVPGLYIYHLQIALSGNLGTTDLLVNEWVLAADVCSGGICSWQVGTLMENNTYDWQVRGRDSQLDLTPWSEAWTFTVDH